MIAMALISGCGVQKTASGPSASTPATDSTGEQTGPSGTEPSTSTGTSDSEAALNAATSQGKPVLLCFHSDSCASCKQMQENIKSVSSAYGDRVAFVEVDVYDAKEESFTAKYGIETIPTTFFIDKDGGTVDKVTGAIPPEELKKQLDALL